MPTIIQGASSGLYRVHLQMCEVLYIWGGVEQQPHRAMFASKKGSSVAVVLWLFLYKASFFFGGCRQVALWEVTQYLHRVI